MAHLRTVKRRHVDTKGRVSLALSSAKLVDVAACRFPRYPQNKLLTETTQAEPNGGLSESLDNVSLDKRAATIHRQ